MGYTFKGARGDFMMSNQTGITTPLGKVFPDFRTKPIVEFEGISAYVFAHHHTVENHPCYNYGYQIGDDISHSFHTQLLIVPGKGEGGFVLVVISGYSNYSERYDQDSVSITCEMGNGQRMDLEHHYFYEKYGGQFRDIKNPLPPLLDYLHKIGFDLSEQQLAKWLSKVRSCYSY